MDEQAWRVVGAVLVMPGCIFILWALGRWANRDR